MKAWRMKQQKKEKKTHNRGYEDQNKKTKTQQATFIWDHPLKVISQGSWPQVRVGLYRGELNQEFPFVSQIFEVGYNHSSSSTEIHPIFIVGDKSGFEGFSNFQILAMPYVINYGFIIADLAFWSLPWLSFN